jgi:hypothetical protein
VQRLSALAAHPRRTLGALAAVLAAVGLTVGSGANFTASAANPGNIFATGSLSIGNSPSTALFNATGLKPGDTATGTVDIQNTGTLSGTFSLATANATGDITLLGELGVVVGDPAVLRLAVADVQRQDRRPHGLHSRHVRGLRQAPLPVHGDPAVQHRRQLPGQERAGRLRVVGDAELMVRRCGAWQAAARSGPPSPLG